MAGCLCVRVVVLVSVVKVIHFVLRFVRTMGYFSLFGVFAKLRGKGFGGGFLLVLFLSKVMLRGRGGCVCVFGYVGCFCMLFMVVVKGWCRGAGLGFGVRFQLCFLTETAGEGTDEDVGFVPPLIVVRVWVS